MSLEQFGNTENNIFILSLDAPDGSEIVQTFTQASVIFSIASCRNDYGH